MKLYHRLAAKLRFFHRLSFRQFDAAFTSDHQFLGQYGEYVAASWLRAHGHRVLRQNFRRRGGGEIDIVSRDGDELVFTEVKTRRSRDGGAPARAVDRQKRDLLRAAARAWLSLLDDDDIPYRFDIIEVLLHEGEAPRVRQLDDIFSMREGFSRATRS